MSGKILNKARWEISLCPTEMVHVHYEIPVSDALEDGFFGLARDLRNLADQLENMSREHGNRPTSSIGLSSTRS